MTDTPATGGSYSRDPLGRLVRQGDRPPAPAQPDTTRAPAPPRTKPKGDQ